MTRLDLLCCCGSSVHIETSELLNAQAERAAWDLRHARCLPDVPDEITNRPVEATSDPQTADRRLWNNTLGRQHP